MTTIDLSDVLLRQTYIVLCLFYLLLKLAALLNKLIVFVHVYDVPLFPNVRLCESLMQLYPAARLLYSKKKFDGAILRVL